MITAKNRKKENTTKKRIEKVENKRNRDFATSGSTASMIIGQNLLNSGKKQ